MDGGRTKPGLSHQNSGFASSPWLAVGKESTLVKVGKRSVVETVPTFYQYRIHFGYGMQFVKHQLIFRIRVHGHNFSISNLCQESFGLNVITVL